MEAQKAFKYRIYPNKIQTEALAKQFGCARFVFNYFLKRRIDSFAQTGAGLSYYDTAKELTVLKKLPEYVWLKEANSQSLQSALKNLDLAYGNFFQKRAKYPKFKKKHNKQSFKVPQFFKLEGNRLTLPKMDSFLLVMHRPLEGEPINLTISKASSGKYFASFQCKTNISEPQYSGKTIGCDFGLKDFVTDSNGIKTQHPKPLKRSQEALKRLQKNAFRKKKGSANRAKAIRRVAKKHEKITSQRNDFSHKLSRTMVNDNQVIILEDLSLKNMVKNHCLAQALSDSGWSEFVRQLEYKGAWYGCKIVKIDRWQPSSKRCHKCGWINDLLALADREWQCLGCKSTHDRDYNAARNILIFGRAGHAQT